MRFFWTPYSSHNPEKREREREREIYHGFQKVIKLQFVSNINNKKKCFLSHKSAY